MDLSDEDLIKEYLNGNQEYLKILIDKYTGLLYNFTVRFVGEDNAFDILQDVFIKVWKNLNKFNIEKANFKTWIFTITRNTITDFLRKKKTIPFSFLGKEEESFKDNLEDEEILQDEAFSKLENKEIVNNILDQLPSNYREVLILYYQEDMTFKEIGEVLNKPLDTVKSYHHRALILLRKML